MFGGTPWNPSSNSSFENNTSGAVLAAQGQPEYTGIKLRTSAQAIPIPIVWGTRRVSPNLIWMTPFKPNASDVFSPAASGPVLLDPEDLGGRGWTHTIGGSTFFAPGFTPGIAPGAWRKQLQITGASTGIGTYGSNDTSSSSSVWWVPMIMALCEGPINGINRIWNPAGAEVLACRW